MPEATPKPEEKDQQGKARQPRADDLGVTDDEIEKALAEADGKPAKKPETRPDGTDGDDDERPARTHAERREAQRRAKARAEQTISELKQQNAHLLERVSRVEGHAVQSAAATVEQRLADAHRQMETAKIAKREARAAENDDAEFAADEALYAARRTVENLAAYKARMADGMRAAAAAPKVGAEDELAPEAKNHAARFVRKNNWYDPQGRDEDSLIVMAVDAAVKREGFDPAGEEYWDELSTRLRRRLPHRFTKDASSGRKRVSEDLDDVDLDDDGGEERSRGGSPTGGSSRESPSGGQSIRVPKAYIDALREAGYDWDDPEIKQRMTRRYIAEKKALDRERK